MDCDKNFEIAINKMQSKIIKKMQGNLYVLKMKEDRYTEEYEREHAYELGFNRAIDKALSIVNEVLSTRLEDIMKEDDFWQWDSKNKEWSNKCNKCCLYCSNEESCTNHCLDTFVPVLRCGICKNYEYKGEECNEEK